MSKNKSFSELKKLFESKLSESTSQDLIWSSSSGTIELEFTQEQLDILPTSGNAEDAVDYLVTKTDLSDQLHNIDPQDIRDELSEYGAWDEEELQDDEQNLHRLVWIAAMDIKEEQYSNDENEVLDEASVTQKMPSGAWEVSAIIDGHLKREVYYFSSKREAIEDFLADYADQMDADDVESFHSMLDELEDDEMLDEVAPEGQEGWVKGTKVKSNEVNEDTNTPILTPTYFKNIAEKSVIGGKLFDQKFQVVDNTGYYTGLVISSITDRKALSKSINKMQNRLDKLSSQNGIIHLAKQSYGVSIDKLTIDNALSYLGYDDMDDFLVYDRLVKIEIELDMDVINEYSTHEEKIQEVNIDRDHNGGIQNITPNKDDGSMEAVLRDARSAVDAMNQELQQMFPNVHAVARLNRSLGYHVTVTFISVPRGHSKDLDFWNADLNFFFMIQMDDAHGRPLEKYSAEVHVRHGFKNAGLSFRKISGKSVSEVLSKVTMWFKKNQEVLNNIELKNTVKEMNEETTTEQYVVVKKYPNVNKYWVSAGTAHISGMEKWSYDIEEAWKFGNLATAKKFARRLNAEVETFGGQSMEENLEKELPIRTYVVKGEIDPNFGDQTYWSNEDGWVDLDSATVFHDNNYDDEIIGQTGIKFLDNVAETTSAGSIAMGATESLDKLVTKSGKPHATTPEEFDLGGLWSYEQDDDNRIQVYKEHGIYQIAGFVGGKHTRQAYRTFTEMKSAVRKLKREMKANAVQEGKTWKDSKGKKSKKDDWKKERKNKEKSREDVMESGFADENAVYRISKKIFDSTGDFVDSVEVYRGTGYSNAKKELEKLMKKEPNSVFGLFKIAGDPENKMVEYENTDDSARGAEIADSQNLEDIKYAIASLGFLLPANQKVTAQEFATMIKDTYDDERTLYLANVLDKSPYGFIKADGKVKVFSKKSVSEVSEYPSDKLKVGDKVKIKDPVRPTEEKFGTISKIDNTPTRKYGKRMIYVKDDSGKEKIWLGTNLSKINEAEQNYAVFLTKDGKETMVSEAVSLTKAEVLVAKMAHEFEGNTFTVGRFDKKQTPMTVSEALKTNFEKIEESVIDTSWNKLSVKDNLKLRKSFRLIQEAKAAYQKDDVYLLSESNSWKVYTTGGKQLGEAGTIWQLGIEEAKAKADAIVAKYVQQKNLNEDVANKHAINIAKKTLKMSDAGVKIAGGQTKEQAREILRKAGWSDEKIKKYEGE